MIDRTNCNERKETLYTTSPSHKNYTTGRYETANSRYNTVTEKRSDSVIKGIIALLSFLALLWLAYGIISSTMHHSSYKMNNDATLREPVIEENLGNNNVETTKSVEKMNTQQGPVTTKTVTTESIH